MILAPATMAAESDPKVAASKCLQEVALDPESYRIGHTKASESVLLQPSALGQDLLSFTFSFFMIWFLRLSMFSGRSIDILSKSISELNYVNPPDISIRKLNNY